jgi:hypothetical protein
LARQSRAPQSFSPWRRRNLLRKLIAGGGEAVMAKGQLRSNKEAKKPKKDKIKSASAPTTASGFAKAGQPAGAAPKKK